MIVKKYDKKEIGSGVYLNEIFNDANEKEVSRGFRISVTETGEYYLSAWAQGLPGTSWNVILDESNSNVGYLELMKNGWQVGIIGTPGSKLIPKAIRLSSGIHTIKFRDDGPGIPDVELLKFGKDEEDALIDETPFRKNLERIMMQSKDSAFNSNDNLVTSQPDYADAQPLVEPDEPYYDYDPNYHKVFNYTFRRSFYLYLN
ncbi:MAG: hypothetical protein JW913_19345 [Chitinispirillaceae bacterium]|nr:hypothetical protein [Chitinispirillaceae bacterium]